MNFKQVNGDLFSADTGSIMAHCISSDCVMGAGIALEFSRRFPNIKEHCLSLKPKVGDALFYHNGNRGVFNLVTKKYYHHKPTYYDLERSLVAMKGQLSARGAVCVAMPKIGCGLDRLNWHKVSSIISSIFSDDDVDIVIYNL